jgi:hypothetical protein
MPAIAINAALRQLVNDVSEIPRIPERQPNSPREATSWAFTIKTCSAAPGDTTVSPWQVAKGSRRARGLCYFEAVRP